MTGELALYYEARGAALVILLVPPTPGDGGQFEALAAALDGYTIVTYDRRGTSRSPSPPGWSTRTLAEQTDDKEDARRSRQLPGGFQSTTAPAWVRREEFR